MSFLDVDINVRRALERNQWGSCDGCRNEGRYCSECHAPKTMWVEKEGRDEEVPGLHFHGCSIAAALELRTRQEP